MPPTKPSQSESQLQAQFWKHVWNNYPQTHRCIWSVPNDAIGQWVTEKDMLRSNELKATGLLDGVWDLHMLWHGKYHIIETKMPGEQLTVDRDVKTKKKDIHGNWIYRRARGQKEWGEIMAAQGAVRHIYHSLEEGVAVIEHILASVQA